MIIDNFACQLIKNVSKKIMKLILCQSKVFESSFMVMSNWTFCDNMDDFHDTPNNLEALVVDMALQSTLLISSCCRLQRVIRTNTHDRDVRSSMLWSNWQRWWQPSTRELEAKWGYKQGPFFLVLEQYQRQMVATTW
jgi:hypothetical protein